MNLTEKQQVIIQHCRSNGTISKVDAVYMLKCFYYTNAGKYVGEILSRMVKSGKLKRIKPGLFELGKGKSDVIITNQPNLF